MRTILLRLRRQETNVARTAVVAAQARASAVRREMDLLDDSMAHYNAAARAAVQSSDAAQTASSRGRWAGIRRERSTCLSAMVSADESLVARRATLADAIRRRRALSMAWHRAAAAESVERARREQKELEDMHVAHVADGWGVPETVETI